MEIIQTPIDGVLILKPRVFNDERGFFIESHHQKRYADVGIDAVFVQDNLSFSQKGILRGLHFQKEHPQAKLIQVIQGEIFDVAVDIRPDSPDFGKWAGVYLSDQNHRQFFIPKGFAHGFCVLSKTAYVYYKCSDFYNSEDEAGILWSDPDLNIDWPVINPVLSSKDIENPLLKNINFN
ncbi:dTDP-4-dehydrorhamnose 3,5-epimerase [Candidatus Magnetomoraceae bacterium gMMP-15]